MLNKMFFAKTFLFVLPMVTGSIAELIKFQNKSSIFCVTDDTESVMYLKPPVVKKSRNTSILIENDETWKDWSLKSSMDVFVPPVLDKRWEDLAITYTDNIYVQSVSSISYSVPVGFNLSIVVSDPIAPSQKKARNISFDWFHWSLYPSGNENATEFKQIQVNITSWNETYFRIHDYKLRWADTISEATATLPVSHNDTPCLMLYVYVCLYCTLNVQLKNRSPQFFTGTNQRSSNVWQKARISLASDATVELFRNTTNGNTQGQWAIDIRQCPVTVANKTIYKVSLVDDVQQGTDRTCILSRLTTKQNNFRQIPSFRRNDDAFSCSPGILGRDCDIQCTELLGSEKQYCEEHKICDNTNSDPECFCSWGYQEGTCEKTCSKGKWGLSCEDTCNNCTLCKAKTGECTSSSPSNFKTASGLLLLGIIFKFLLIKC